MIAILNKEIQSFFSSSIGYLVIGLFLIINGLFLWVFQGDFNVFNYGFAELSAFFRLAPWILMFLIPAVTMRSIAEERKQGTIELLLTKPINSLQLTLGKYFGALVLIIIAILPTLIYVWSIISLKQEGNHIDTGVLFTSYLGMILLAACYTSIGLFASSLTKNQIVAFVIAMFLCFTMFYGFEGVSSQFVNSTSIDISYLGLKYHYEDLGRGVLDIRNIIYFFSVITVFILLTQFNIKRFTS